MYELLMSPLVRLQIAALELRERQDGQTTTEYAILLGFLAIAIIIALFLVQRIGTAKIGHAFGPIMTLWFLFLGGTGLFFVCQYPAVLLCLNPLRGIAFLLSPNNHAGIMILGSCFLATTGAEALYSDMGHVGRGNIYALVELDGGNDDLTVGEMRRLMQHIKTHLGAMSTIQVRLFMHRSAENDRRSSDRRDGTAGVDVCNRQNDRRQAEGSTFHTMEVGRRRNGADAVRV